MPQPTMTTLDVANIYRILDDLWILSRVTPENFIEWRENHMANLLEAIVACKGALDVTDVKVTA